MSYDAWKTDPDYDESRQKVERNLNLGIAVKQGFYIYDNPVEAKLCYIAKSQYVGTRYGEPFKGIPYPERGRND